MFAVLKHSLLEFFYPPYCILCDKKFQFDDLPICKKCWYQLKVVGEPYCSRCGAQLAAETELCLACKGREYEFTHARVLMTFDKNTQSMMHHIKYKHKRKIAQKLGESLGHQLKFANSHLQVDALIPVPLHVSRKRWRGFNQSDYISKGIGSILDIPVYIGNLQRIRKTKSQTGFTAEERVKNITGVFRIKNPKTVEGRHLALIDDVMTTGATLNECAKILTRAGAKSVCAFTLARA